MRNDDLISRTAAIKAFTSKPPEYYHTSYIVGELNDIPAVDVVPVVHGRPVRISPFGPDARVCIWRCLSRCSICGEYVVEDWKYCPNCGALMDVEAKEALE